MDRRILIFTVTRLSDIIEKGNAWYVKNYEFYFDDVTVAYLIAGGDEAVRGKTRLVPLGRRSGSNFDLLFAPFRLLRLAKIIRPDVVVTADQWYSWWTGILLRWIYGAHVVLMPVSMPEQLYRDGGVTISGWPLWLDRSLRWLSFSACRYVYTGRAFGDFVTWLRHHPQASHKLIVGDGLVEAMPSPEFMNAAKGLKSGSGQKNQNIRIVYVGRLAREKLVDHAILALKYLPENFELALVGDGPERASLERLAAECGVGSRVTFRGRVNNEDLPSLLEQCDLFVSTLTGTSLREAALLGLPIVAYNRDWIVGLLKHEESALLVTDGDVEGLALQLLRLGSDSEMRSRVSEGAKQLAERLWSEDAARQSLALMYETVRQGRTGSQ